LRESRSQCCSSQRVRRVEASLQSDRQSSHQRSPSCSFFPTLRCPAMHRFPLGDGSPGRRAVRSSDLEDGSDAQEEAPENGPQLRDQIKLHHFTQLGVVTGSMGLKLQRRKMHS
ncbi:hypothetical protein XENOCAPTIV_002923, partial [Xenoophorus captivus]